MHLGPIVVPWQPIVEPRGPIPSITVHGNEPAYRAGSARPGPSACNTSTAGVVPFPHFGVGGWPRAASATRLLHRAVAPRCSELQHRDWHTYTLQNGVASPPSGGGGHGGGGEGTGCPASISIGRMLGTRAGRREGGTSHRPGAVPLDSVGSEGAGTAGPGTEEHETGECASEVAGMGTGTENADGRWGDKSICTCELGTPDGLSTGIITELLTAALSRKPGDGVVRRDTASRGQRLPCPTPGRTTGPNGEGGDGGGPAWQLGPHRRLREPQPQHAAALQ
eukprot:gene17948-biopygen5598